MLFWNELIVTVLVLYMAAYSIKAFYNAINNMANNRTHNVLAVLVVTAISLIILIMILPLAMMLNGSLPFNGIFVGAVTIGMFALRTRWIDPF